MADIQDQIFEPFLSTKPDGIGLSLTESFGIVMAHGGNYDFIPCGERGV